MTKTFDAIAVAAPLPTCLVAAQTDSVTDPAILKAREAAR